MLKLKDLESMGTVSFGAAEEVTLDSIKEAITDLAAQNQIPIAFYTEDAKEGGLLSNAVPALVAYHPEHRRDYFNMAMILNKQGSFGSVAVYAAGKSKQMNKFARHENAKANTRGAVGSVLAGGGSYAVGAAIGSAVSGAFLGLGKSKAKLQEEELYYDIVLQLIGTALNE